MDRLWRWIGVALLVGASGCMSFEVEGDGSQTPDSFRDSYTFHGSFWGFHWGDDVRVCEDGGLYRVEFLTNPGFVLVSVLSLGLWVPQTAEWWCNAPDHRNEANEDDDGEDVWDPDADLGYEEDEDADPER